jgi:hypothetical protein
MVNSTAVGLRRTLLLGVILFGEDGLPAAVRYARQRAIDFGRMPAIQTGKLGLATSLDPLQPQRGPVLVDRDLAHGVEAMVGASAWMISRLKSAASLDDSLG